jgi:hypothetical protein
LRPSLGLSGLGGLDLRLHRLRSSRLRLRLRLKRRLSGLGLRLLNRLGLQGLRVLRVCFR